MDSFMVTQQHTYSIVQAVQSSKAGHGHRNLGCLYWKGFLGIHYTWVKNSLKDHDILDLQGRAITKGSQAVLKEDSHPWAILKFYHLCSKYLIRGGTQGGFSPTHPINMDIHKNLKPKHWSVQTMVFKTKLPGNSMGV